MFEMCTSECRAIFTSLCTTSFMSSFNLFINVCSLLHECVCKSEVQIKIPQTKLSESDEAFVKTHLFSKWVFFVCFRVFLCFLFFFGQASPAGSWMCFWHVTLSVAMWQLRERLIKNGRHVVAPPAVLTVFVNRTSAGEARFPPETRPPAPRSSDLWPRLHFCRWSPDDSEALRRIKVGSQRSFFFSVYFWKRYLQQLMTLRLLLLSPVHHFLKCSAHIQAAIDSPIIYSIFFLLKSKLHSTQYLGFIGNYNEPFWNSKRSFEFEGFFDFRDSTVEK